MAQRPAHFVAYLGQEVRRLLSMDKYEGPYLTRIRDAQAAHVRQLLERACI
jgi:hypothetical protein